ncbi:MAG: HepT-like ribonuclease domain-containing protein [Saprospiraceae bacterium]
MPEEILSWLEDIENAIEEINSFIPKEMDFEDFQKDIKTRRAVERNIEIIGEAVNRILKNDGEVKISDARKIVDTRNRIIHGYDAVSVEVLWSIIKKSLPILLDEIQSLKN